MRAGESLPHRESGNMSTTRASTHTAAPGAWIHAFMPFPGVAGAGHGGTQGRLVAGLAPLRSDPTPLMDSRQRQVGLVCEDPASSPDEMGSPWCSWELPGECSLWNSALFWPSSALGLDSGRGLARSCLEKGVPKGSVPSTSHLPARSALLLAAPVSSQAGPKVKAAG